MNLGRQLQ